MYNVIQEGEKVAFCALKGIRRLEGEYRGAFHLSLEILARARGGINTTKIVYRTNLNFKMIRPHLERLEKEGLIKRGRGLIETTEKGLEVLKHARNLDRLLITNRMVPHKYP